MIQWLAVLLCFFALVAPVAAYPLSSGVFTQQRNGRGNFNLVSPTFQAFGTKGQGTDLLAGCDNVPQSCNPGDTTTSGARASVAAVSTGAA